MFVVQVGKTGHYRPQQTILPSIVTTRHLQTHDSTYGRVWQFTFKWLESVLERS